MNRKPRITYDYVVSVKTQLKSMLKKAELLKDEIDTEERKLLDDNKDEDENSEFSNVSEDCYIINEFITKLEFLLEDLDFKHNQLVGTNCKWKHNQLERGV